MEVSGDLHDPATLPQGKQHGVPVSNHTNWKKLYTISTVKTLLHLFPKLIDVVNSRQNASGHPPLTKGAGLHRPYHQQVYRVAHKGQRFN